MEPAQQIPEPNEDLEKESLPLRILSFIVGIMIAIILIMFIPAMIRYMERMAPKKRSPKYSRYIKPR